MSNSKVIIRQAEFSDIDSLVSLLQVLFSIEEDFVFHEEKQQSGIMQMLDDDRSCLLVAEVNGQLIGMCSGQLTLSTAEGGLALLVEDVVVHQDVRQQGIGRLLMDEITQWGKKQGVSRFQLLADRNNTQALEFYKNLGWQTTQLICLRHRWTG